MSYDIGPRLRRYREAQNLSQKELAKRIGVSNSRVSNWEQGINRPDVDILADICTVLNISPSELLDVHLSPDDLSDQERKVIMQYRTKPELPTEDVSSLLPGQLPSPVRTRQPIQVDNPIRSRLMDLYCFLYLLHTLINRSMLSMANVIFSTLL